MGNYQLGCEPFDELFSFRQYADIGVTNFNKFFGFSCNLKVLCGENGEKKRLSLARFLLIHVMLLQGN